MSKKQAIAFFEEISKNQQLAKEVEKVVGGKNSDEEKAKELISLAKKHNFNFTQEDAKNAQDALKKPLSPEEMLEVSGGKMNLKASLMAAAMLFGLGASVDALHNMEASAMKRSAPHQNNGKRGKTDQTLHGFDELIFSLSNQAPQEQPTTTPQPVGGQQQIAPQTVGRVNPRYHVVDAFPELAPNLTQNGTTPSGSQGAVQSAERPAPGQPQEKKKARPIVEHDREAAERFKEVKHCGPNHVNWSRRVSASGALPAENWPAAPPANFDAKKEICRFCGKKLEARGKQELDVKCANAGCIYNWVFPPTGTKKNEGNQRGRTDKGHYVRWALLPALILDSRWSTIGSGFLQQPRPAAIMTPAEAWAVWQLIVGHNNGWADVDIMMQTHSVDATTIDRVKNLLEGSYDNLVQGNEHLRDLVGSEVQQLAKGEQEKLRATMENRFLKGKTGEELAKAKESIEYAATLMEHAYNMLTDEQLQRTGYKPTQILRHPEAALAEIEAAHQRFETAMQQKIEEARQQEEARRQEEYARETARRQTIEMLQRVEQLSVEQAKAIAPMLTCGSKTCGNIGASAYKKGGRVYFQCAKCRKAISNKPADLLVMLQAVVPENVSMEMADAEQNEQQMGTQYMSQFNPGQQRMMLRNTTHNDYGMDFDEDEDYVDRDFYDRDGNLRKLKEQQPPEVKEQREDYIDTQDAGETRAFEFGAHQQKPEDNSDTVSDENIQMMEEGLHVGNQTRHNVVPSAFRPSTEDFQIIEGTEFNQELQGYSQRHLQLMMQRQAERRFEMQHKDYENQETNPNIPQLPHLQPHRSMILENTNEIITPLETANLGDIGEALINEISKEAPDFARIQSMLQSAKEVKANISQLLSFDDVLTLVRDFANSHRRDDIISFIDSWRWH